MVSPRCCRVSRPVRTRQRSITNWRATATIAFFARCSRGERSFGQDSPPFENRFVVRLEADQASGQLHQRNTQTRVAMFGHATLQSGVAAGFRRVELKPFSLTARFPNPDVFIAGEIEVDTAAIPSMQHLDSRAREAIVAAITADMQSPLKEVTHDNHVVIPFHGHIVRAWL